MNLIENHEMALKLTQKEYPIGQFVPVRSRLKMKGESPGREATGLRGLSFPPAAVPGWLPRPASLTLVQSKSAYQASVLNISFSHLH